MNSGYGSYGSYGSYGQGGRSVYGAAGASSPMSQKKTYYSESSKPAGVSLAKPAPAGRPGSVAKPSAASSASASSTKEIFKAGDRVKHFVFGSGEIISVKPMGTDTLYEIIFDRAGTKKLMATYAKLKRE